MVPLIARLHEAQSAYKREKVKNEGIRAQLSHAVGEVLELQISDREGELVADVLIELMAQAETDLRHAIAEQLSVLDNVPLRLLLQLANDDIEIARPILTKSPVLGDLDLIYIIKSKTPEYWQAIASRQILGAKVIDVLADTRDFDTALSLAENMHIRLTEHSMTVLADLAQGSETLSVPLIRRADVPEEIAKALYQYVGEEMKKFITRNFDIDQSKVLETVDNVVAEFTENAHFKDFIPEEYMIKAAQAFMSKNMLNTKLMMNTLRRGHIRSFVAQFSVFTEIPIAKVCQILSQANGHGLAIACKALEIDKQDFVSMFMLTSKIRDHGRMVEMDEIRKAVSYFNIIKHDAALAFIREKTTTH